MHVVFLRKRERGARRRNNWPSWPRIGITVVEIDADRRFPGKFRMGLRWSRSFRAISPLRNAGRSRQFIDRGHSLGLAVILDVVYNHFGPDGNYLAVLFE